MEPTQLSKPVDPIEDAEEARDELREVLEDVGVPLPSLGVDVGSLASCYLPPLVDLGRCTPHTARRLASALRSSLRER
jgi:hypothetical protein